VPVGHEDLRDDGLALGRDAVPVLPEHGHHGSGSVHGVRLVHRRCGGRRGQGPDQRVAARGGSREPTGL
jgi:hypothetical protein